MTDCVVIVRTHSGEDLIAIIVGERDNKVRVEHPYYIKYNPAQGAVGMLPYCALTDEIYFEIDRSKVDFVVTANEEITTKFLRMIDSVEQTRQQEIIEADKPYERLEAAMSNNTFVEGNSTKH